MNMSEKREIETGSFADVADLVEDAIEDGVEARPRNDDKRYRVDDVAIACMWTPRNRSNLRRLSHCWVAEDARGEDIGKSLVERRFEDAKREGADKIDSYAYREQLYEEPGFEARESYDMGTTHMVWERGGGEDG